MDEEGSKLKTEELYTLHLPILARNGEREKLIMVIESCVSIKQIVVAEKYLRLWVKKYGKPDESVNRLLLSKKMKLKHGWDNRN
jgi:hypothetical protein